ncbi:MAG TPA: hypothetical protein VGF63_13085 [Solirubrobacteraceae bacterium]|jgi:hypothetical protein
MAIGGGLEGTPSRPGGFARGANRNAETGQLLVGLGAILLLISLFLNWYRHGVDAWTAFEAWDLILAAIAIIALVAVLSRLGFGAPRPNSWLIGPSVAALVIVVFVAINPPPVVAGANANGTGLWLGLVSSALMSVGALLSVARFSVALTTAPPSVGAPGTPPADMYAREPLDPAAREPTVRATRS